MKKYLHMSEIFCNFAAQNVWSRDIEMSICRDVEEKILKTTIQNGRKQRFD